MAVAATGSGAPRDGLPRSRWADHCVPEVFIESAAANSARVAIRSEKSDLTYAQLLDNARRVAGALHSLASDSPRRVALLFEQGPEAITAMLGALIAGETYVLLDPADPVQRIEFILEDSLASVIVTNLAQTALASRLAGDERKVLRVDRLDGSAKPSSEFDPVPADAIAYLCYTSGSTGKPKGVMQSHRNLLHFVGSYSDRLNIVPEDRVSLLYTLSFSAANMDIYGALLTGAVLCPYDIRRRGAPGLPAWIRETRISVLHTVPTLFRHLGEASAGEPVFDTVRVIDLGGEAVYSSDIRLWRDRFRNDAPLLNHLAATEASVIAQYEVPSEEQGPDGTLPVGPASPGVEFRIVRDDGSAAGPEEPGEIVLHSPFLSPGYWNRPELNSVAFGQDEARAGWRVYRSGDLGKVDAKGLLYALGRRDDRVKIRGHSVDLAEAEAGLRDADGVQDAAMVAVEDETETSAMKLAAYVVGDGLTPGELRRSLASRLPEYMLPSEINVLASLPRTGTGKIDRKMLSGPDRPRSRRERDLTPPADEIERRVAGIYARLLGLEQVGRSEDFFELGGNSLKTAQLQIDLRGAFGRDAPLGQFLRDSTVAGVAAWLRLHASAGKAAGRAKILIPIRTAGSRPALFLVHGALMNAFVSPSFLRILGDDQPFYAFQARGLDGTEKTHSRIPAMARDYVEAIREIQPKGPYYVGGLCTGGILAHEMACQLAQQGERLAPLLLIDPVLPPAMKRWKTRLKWLRKLYLTRLPIRLASTEKIVEEIRGKVERRAGEGRVLVRQRDDAAVAAVVRAAIDFKIALHWHRPHVYSGDAHILASRRRHKEMAGTKFWKRNVTGQIRVLTVGMEHQDVLDPGNESFARELRICLDAAYEAVKDGPR